MLAAALAVAWFGAVWAEELEYDLRVRAGQRATLSMEFHVDHPGAVVVHAEWEGSRPLLFRVETPGTDSMAVRRTGPSPQQIRIDADESLAALDEPWRLVVHALPMNAPANGIVRLTLPDPPETTVEQGVPQPSEPEREAPPVWSLTRAAPAGAAPAVRDFHVAVEDFRSWVVTEDGTFREDACGWHTHLLRYLSEQRELAVLGRLVVEDDTRRFLRRLAGTIEGVEELRSSEDPLVSGPPPADPRRRRAWVVVRRQRTDPLELELDNLRQALRRGYVPQLAAQRWPQRFLGCLTACERHFEQLPRLGPQRASNTDLARVQWDGILRAGRALDAMTALEPASDPRSTFASAPPTAGPRR